ncbi:MAG: small acid-soluble spore protein Tlp [Tissierellia bacterium]|nr:small acid-soluble spore protein Tlp [Tissierellia bacterium]MDD4780295.1 small acid-soluble spore protein Tlp [Tissierellia bacterium]
MGNKTNSEDRRDFVNKVKIQINNTIENHRETERLINQVDDEAFKTELQIRNMRREQSLRSMKKDLKDEVIDKNNNYK